LGPLRLSPHGARGSHMFDMRRRDFITLLGGAAATFLDSRLPLEAQQANKIYRLGVLSPSSASVDSIRAVTVPELAKAGFIEGQNLVIDARAGVGSQIPELARALVASPGCDHCRLRYLN
jgi:hypothetical protein